jgi:hypothetical protein
LGQYTFKFDRRFTLIPSRDLLKKFWLNLLERLRFLFQIQPQPLNGTAFIGYKNGKLLNIRNLGTLCVIFMNLLGKKEHAVSFGISLPKARIEFRRRKWNDVASLNVERNHPVKQQVVLALRDNLSVPF